MKIVLGIMDAEDAQNIENRINKLSNGTKTLTEEAAEQRNFYQETLGSRI